jgi:hypothetical protein
VTQSAQRNTESAELLGRRVCGGGRIPGKFFLLSTSLYKRGQSVDRRPARGWTEQGEGWRGSAGRNGRVFGWRLAGHRVHVGMHIPVQWFWTGLGRLEGARRSLAVPRGHQFGSCFFAGRSGVFLQTRSANKGFRLGPVVRLSQWSELGLGDQNFRGKSILGLRGRSCLPKAAQSASTPHSVGISNLFLHRRRVQEFGALHPFISASKPHLRNNYH